MSAAEEERGPRAVVFPARRQAGVIGKFSGLQLTSIAIAASILITSLLTSAGDIFGGIERAFVPAVSFFVLGVWTDTHGYPLVLIVLDRGRFLMRKALGQTRYRRPIGAQPMTTGSLRLPGGLASLEIFEVSPGQQAIIDDVAGGVFIAVLEVTTPGYGLLDSQAKRERVDGWALFQSTLVRQPGLARIQVLSVSSVSPPTAINDHYEARKSDQISEWGTEQYELLLEHGVANSPQQTQYIAVVLERRRLAKDIRAQGGGQQGMSSIMFQQVAALTAGLAEAGITVRKWLSSREAAAAIRGAYDPDSAALIDAREAERAGVSPDSAGPVAGDEEWGYIRTDSAFHQTFEVTEWPRIPTLPDFLGAVTSLSFPVALSLYFTPVTLKLSLRRIKVEQGNIDSNRELRRRRGNSRDDSAFEIRERADVAERESELAQGFGDLEFIGLITVSAPTREELVGRVSGLRTAVEGRGMEVRSLNGQQLAAFNCARLPLGLAPSASQGKAFGA